MDQTTPERASRPTSVTVIGWLFIIFTGFTVIAGIFQVLVGLTGVVPWYSALLPYSIIGMVIMPILYIVLYVLFLKGRGWARATIEVNLWVGVAFLVLAAIGLSIFLPLADNVIGDLSGGEAAADGFSFAPFLAVFFVVFAIIGGVYGLLLYFLRKKDVRAWFQTTSHDYAIAGGIVAGTMLLTVAVCIWTFFSLVKMGPQGFGDLSNYEDPYDTFADESSLLPAAGLYQDDLGFSLRLPEVPEDTFAIKKEEDLGLFTSANNYPDVPITYTRFTVDATNTTWPENRYDAFIVGAYPREWWDAHMTVDADGYLQLDDESDVFTEETFAGQNTAYAFTFSSSIECPLSPDNLNEETWQCELAHTARQTVLPTFKTFK